MWSKQRNFHLFMQISVIIIMRKSFTGVSYHIFREVIQLHFHVSAEGLVYRINCQRLSVIHDPKKSLRKRFHACTLSRVFKELFRLHFYLSAKAGCSPEKLSVFYVPFSAVTQLFMAQRSLRKRFWRVLYHIFWAHWKIEAFPANFF